MRSLKMTVLALLVATSINAQINLEHTYNVSATNSTLTTIQLANSGYKFVLNEPSLNQVKLYNTNHSLWKTITVPTIPGFTLSNVMHISENLFNLDAQVEYIAYYYNISTTPAQYYTKIINENGTVIKDFPDRIPAGVVATGANTFKLIVSDANLIREVYSLPGTSNNLGVFDNEGTSVGFSYPNPASHFITLPYNLNGTNTGVLTIYNLSGQVVESFDVDTTFDSILLDVSNYPTGMYRYGIGGLGTGTFVKQ
jgi:hypothetical protein